MRTLTSIRLLLVPAVALLAAACDDAPLPQEPAAAKGDVPTREGVPVRQDGAALLASATHWADGYLKTEYENIAFYSPGPSYSFNRAARFGGAITITKPTGTTGRYVATFPGLSSYLGGRSTVHVSGFYHAPDGTYCKPAGAYLVSDKVEVRCFKVSTGAPANANFSLLVTRNYADLAFAYAHQPTATSYSPSSQGSWNPAGTSTVTRTGVGQYRVTFNNLGALLPTGVLGHAQVNAVGTSNAYCNAFNAYLVFGTTNLAVDVRCYATPTGAPVDRAFTVLFTLPADHLAYAWADKPAAASYSPLPYFSSNPSRQPITIARSGVGTYLVDWAGVDPYVIDEGNLHVTGYGSNAVCRIANATLTRAYIKCFAPNGTPVDSRYTVMFAS
jgi:hypothetical protein